MAGRERAPEIRDLPADPDLGAKTPRSRRGGGTRSGWAPVAGISSSATKTPSTLRLHRPPCRMPNLPARVAGGDERNPHPTGERLADGSGPPGSGDVGRDQRRDAPQIVGGDAQEAQPAAKRNRSHPREGSRYPTGPQPRSPARRRQRGTGTSLRGAAPRGAGRRENRDVADQAGSQTVPGHGTGLNEGTRLKPLRG